MENIESFKSIDYPHNRFNPLKNEWVLVCPHRSRRPWMGQVEKKDDDDGDQRNNDAGQDIPPSANPLSPGATRSSGVQNPNYSSTYTFDNDFSALNDIDPNSTDKNVEEPESKKSPLFRFKPALGRCRVMCFHPDSRKSLPLMSVDEVQTVINAWIDEFKKLAETYLWVQIFENKGSMMGCSNPHPHCQIWASRFMPNEPDKMDHNQREYFRKHKRPMLLDYVHHEISAAERIILKNDHWVVLVPFWAIWPFETMILAHHRPIHRLDQLQDEERHSLALIMKKLLIKYDNLFQTSFPYSMAWHGAPTGPGYQSENVSNRDQHWTLHAIYYPPLLRSASVKKFMVGYELAAQPQRDITPEKAAEILRETCGDEHYSHKQ